MRFALCTSLFLLMKLLLVGTAPIADNDRPPAPVASVTVTDDHSYAKGNLYKAEAPERHNVVGINAHPGSFYTLPLERSFIMGEQTRACTFRNGSFRELELRHAIMLDAGSSSTKIQAYKLQYCGNSFFAVLNDELESAYSLKTEKASNLEPFINDDDALAREATKYVTNVFAVASQKIVPGQENQTIVALMATAGMRLMGSDKAEKIMQAISKAMKVHRDKMCAEKGHCLILPPNSPAARLIDGAEEGVWAWMTSNIFEHKIGYQAHTGARNPVVPQTSAIMDVGGASTQLVYEITADDVKSLTDLFPGYLSPLYTLTFEGQSYPLFQQSFLYFGNDQIRLRIASKYYEVADGLKKDAIGYTSRYPSKEDMIRNDYIDFNDISRFICLNDHMERDTHFKGHKLSGRITDATRNASAACQYWVNMVFHPDSYGPHLNSTPSTYYPCMKTLHKSPKIRGFNTLTHFTRWFVGDDATTVNMDTLTQIREWVCDKKVPANRSPFEDPRGGFFSCQEAVYLEALFKDNYKLPRSVEVDVALEVNNKAIGWTLGAVLTLIAEVDRACS